MNFENSRMFYVLNFITHYRENQLNKLVTKRRKSCFQLSQFSPGFESKNIISIPLINHFVSYENLLISLLTRKTDYFVTLFWIHYTVCQLYWTALWNQFSTKWQSKTCFIFWMVIQKRKKMKPSQELTGIQKEQNTFIQIIL